MRTFRGDSCVPLYFALILSLLLLSCRSDNTVELPEVETQSDSYAGEMVEDMAHAQGLILERYANAPQVGETAPETRLFDPESVKEIDLSSLFAGKPVVLIFGSWSCTTTSLYAEDYGDLYRRFHGVADFYFIYLREAHPEGGFQPILESDMAKVVIPSIPDPEVLPGRCRLAEQFRDKKHLPMRFLVDSMDDNAAVLWGAWPARLFVIDAEGRVIYSGGQGPWYYKLTKEGWHYPPPVPIEKVLNSLPFAKISLEEFLEKFL